MTDKPGVHAFKWMYDGQIAEETVVLMNSIKFLQHIYVAGVELTYQPIINGSSMLDSGIYITIIVCVRVCVCVCS